MYKLFFTSANFPFVVIHYNKLENLNEQVKLWYGIFSNPVNLRIYSPNINQSNILEIKSSIKLTYALNSSEGKENYVQSTESSSGGSDIAEINLNYFFEPWMLRNEIHKKTGHTIIVGGDILDWHASMNESFKHEHSYLFTKLVQPMFEKIINKLSREYLSKINTAYMRW